MSSVVPWSSRRSSNLMLAACLGSPEKCMYLRGGCFTRAILVLTGLSDGFRDLADGENAQEGNEALWWRDTVSRHQGVMAYVSGKEDYK